MAVLLTMNLMIGAGVFVNLSTLTKLAGPYGFLGYLLGELVLLPVVISLSTLASIHAVAGGLFVYGKEYLHPFAGFLSSWSYFLGKCVSAALLSNALVSALYAAYPCMKVIPQLGWCCGFMLTLVCLNVLGVHVGGRVQWIFTVFKAVPMLAVIVSAIIRGGWSNGGLWVTDGAPQFLQLVPVALFALSGFEVICTIGHLVENPRKNAVRVAVGSSLVVTLIYVVFQFSAYVHTGLALCSPAYLAILGSTLVPPFKTIGFMINDFIYAAMVSAVFNLLANNAWNMFAMARDGFFPASGLLTRCSASGVPWVALLVEASLSLVILILTTDLIALQNMSVLGTVASYFISTLAALVAFYRNRVISWLIPLAGLMSCAYVLVLCYQRLMISGLSGSFMIIFLAGLMAAGVQVVMRGIKS